MLYLGLDVHSKWFTLAGFVKETGESVEISRISNCDEAISLAFAQLPMPRVGAMETGTNSIAMHRILEPYFENLIIVSPNAVWDRRRNSEPKTDQRDAYNLAQDLSMGRLKPIYLPDDTIRAYRTLCRGRVQVTQDITRLVNTLYALLRSWGYQISKKLLTKGGRDWVDTVILPEHAWPVLDLQITRLDELIAQQRILDERIALITDTDSVCQLLRTIPYVGPLTALVLRAEIGNINRFASADKLISYAGLDPRVYQSGERCRYGRLSKHGNSYLRYISVVFAQNAVRGRKDTDFRRRFYRLCHAHHPNEIKVMLARDFLAVVHSMWRTGSVWREPLRTIKPVPSSVA
jgi:transposase